MNDIEKRAVEHLAEAYRRKGQPGLASMIIEREGRTNSVWGDVALSAIIAALTPPEGWVLVAIDSVDPLWGKPHHFMCGDCGAVLGGFDPATAAQEVTP